MTGFLTRALCAHSWATDGGLETSYNERRDVVDVRRREVCDSCGKTRWILMDRSRPTWDVLDLGDAQVQHTRSLEQRVAQLEAVLATMISLEEAIGKAPTAPTENSVANATSVQKVPLGRRQAV